MGLVEMLKRFFLDANGVTSIEYGLIASTIGIGLIASVSLVGSEIGNTTNYSAYAMSGVDLEDIDKYIEHKESPDGVIGEDGDIDLSDAAAEIRTTQDGQGHTYIKTAELEGWDLVGHSSVEIVESGHDGVVVPGGGSWLDMKDQPENVHISKDLDLASGGAYTVDFLASNRRANIDGTLDVYFGGELVGSVRPTPGVADLSSYSIDIVGGAGDGTNTLEFQQTGAEGGKGTALANIVVQ